LEKTNKSNREAITKNNQIFRQRMGTLNAENTQLKSNLETAQKETATITEERDSLKASAAAESATSEPLAEELERLRKEKVALEQALEEEKSKKPAQMPPPDTSDLESRLVCCFDYVYVAYSDCPPRPHLRRSETNLSQKRRNGRSTPKRRRSKQGRRTGRLKKWSSSRAVMMLLRRPR
jgi:hypothetical protein